MSSNKARVATVLSQIDKSAVARLAATVAAEVSSRHSNPTVRTIAGLVAKGMRTAQVPREEAEPARPASFSQSKPPFDDASGRKRALEILQTHRAETYSSSQPRTGAAQVSAQVGARQEVLQGFLAGYYDTVNIGTYGFTLIQGAELLVGSFRSSDSGNIGGQFQVEHLPAAVWHRLKDRGARLLPIWVQWRGDELHILVGSGPANARVINATKSGQ
jgi:hypothetical protein